MKFNLNPKQKLHMLTFPKVRSVLSNVTKRTEQDNLIRQLNQAAPMMEELALLMEEKTVCHHKLRELKYKLDHPVKAAKVPLVACLCKGSTSDELKNQIAAYRSMEAGIDGHMYQLVLHQYKKLSVLGAYFYPVAVTEITRFLEDGTAENLHDAIGLYEEELERWRSSGSNAGMLKKARAQAEYMEKVLTEIQNS